MLLGYFVPESVLVGVPALCAVLENRQGIIAEIIRFQLQSLSQDGQATRVSTRGDHIWARSSWSAPRRSKPSRAPIGQHQRQQPTGTDRKEGRWVESQILPLAIAILTL
jgi:hypothetical protein